MTDLSIAISVVIVLFTLSSIVCIQEAKKKGQGLLFWGLMGFVFGPSAVWVILFTNTDDDPDKMSDSFVDRVRYYFELGLLDDKNNTSLEAVTESIRQKYIENWGESFETDRPIEDRYILGYGSKKTWWRDTEADVLNGNNVYVNTIKEWSTISEGVFLPSQIEEYWGTDEGPIEIGFNVNTTSYSFVPGYLEDYIDMDLLTKINKLLPDTGNKFEMVEPFDQTAFVLWLSKKQKKALIQRGWKFA